MVNLLEKIQRFLIRTDNKLNEPLPWKKMKIADLNELNLFLSEYPETNMLELSLIHI